MVVREFYAWVEGLGCGGRGQGLTAVCSPAFTSSTDDVGFSFQSKHSKNLLLAYRSMCNIGALKIEPIILEI